MQAGRHAGKHRLGMGQTDTQAHPASHTTHLQGLCCHERLYHKLGAWRHLHVHVCPSPQHLAGDELYPRLHSLQQNRAGSRGTR